MTMVGGMKKKKEKVTWRGERCRWSGYEISGEDGDWCQMPEEKEEKVGELCGGPLM
jgi:hypothetical protein